MGTSNFDRPNGPGYVTAWYLQTELTKAASFSGTQAAYVSASAALSGEVVLYVSASAALSTSVVAYTSASSALAAEVIVAASATTAASSSKVVLISVADDAAFGSLDGAVTASVTSTISGVLDPY